MTSLAGQVLIVQRVALLGLAVFVLVVFLDDIHQFVGFYVYSY